MARSKLPVGPVAIWGLLKELRVAALPTRHLAVTGPPSLAGALRRELARGGDATLVREGPIDGAAALVHVLAAPPSGEDERTLRLADAVRVPAVAVLADPGLDDRAVPYVLATDVVRVPRGSAFPVDGIARLVAHKLEARATGLAARLPALRRAVCDELVESYARRNGIVGAAVFVPGVDMPVLTLNQLRLVLRIAAAHGEEVDAQRLPEVAGVIGSAFGFRALARELLDLVPVAGWLVKGAVAYAGTRAVGEAAVRYFGGRPSASAGAAAPTSSPSTPPPA